MATTTLPDVAHYTYRVMWSGEDNEHVATCLEFPSLSWLAPLPDEALRGLQVLLGDVVRDMAERNESIPAPLTSRSYSGKFNVRVGEYLHRELAIAAADAGLSLNQYVLLRLARSGS